MIKSCTMDLKDIVKEKLIGQEECEACVVGFLRENGQRLLRVVSVIKGQEEHGVFFFQSSSENPKVSTDLNFDRALPVSDTFKFNVTPQGASTAAGQRLMTVKITVETLCMEMEVEEGSVTGRFLNSLKLASQVQSQNAGLLGLPSTFSWIDNYRSTSKSDNPFLSDVFDPLNPAKGMKDDWAISLLAQQAGLEDCPIVEDDSLHDKPPSHGHSVIETSTFHSASETNLSALTGSNADLTNTLKKEFASSDNLAADVVSSNSKAQSREKLIRLIMKSKEDQYTEENTIKVFCGTWNVNGQPASEELQPWLNPAEYPDPPDIYAIGFQELDLSKNAMIFTESPREEEWYKRVSAALPPDARYQKVRLERLVGMMIIVFVKEGLPVRNVVSAQVGTGLMGMMGNKGGVAVRMDINNTSLCFVNTHLAAHTQEFERRNQDFRDINTRMNFGGRNPQLAISDHDIVFWIGDLNYRLTNDVDNDRCKSYIKQNRLHELLQHDQLYQQKSRKKVFIDYYEGRITFVPTYKYDPGTDNWDSSEKCRVPAWCDRVLWRGSGAKLLKYRSHMELKLSDHKPVSAYFDTKVKVINQMLYKRVYEDTMKELDRLENDFLPQVELDTRDLVFKNVKFMDPHTCTVTVANTGQVPVQFEFINKMNDHSFCKDWLSIKPSKAVININDKIEVQFEVFVNRFTAPALNSGDDKIDDILVMHLEGGKDLFITVSGNYLPSCFGSSIDALVRMFGPIRDVETATLIQLEHTSISNQAVSSPPSTPVDRPLDIPKEVWRLVDHLFKNGLEQQDLFLQPGLQSEIALIRDSLDTGQPSILPGTIHSIAEVLLIFLESTMEPVIPYSFYSKCLHSASNPDLCKQILKQIPESHRKLFEYVCSFLRKCLVYAHKNGLSASDLALVFGGIMLRPPVQKDSKPQKTSRRDEERLRAAFVYNFISNNA